MRKTLEKTTDNTYHLVVNFSNNEYYCTYSATGTH